MALDYIIPEFDVVRNDARCTRCRICETQCANGVHTYNADGKVMVSDESKCVNCQRCVSFCPTHALKIVKNENCLRENANWSCATVKEIYKQASTGGVLLSSMGNPQPLPVYWDRLLINASQVTNPPIDPLREPMETRVFLGKKPSTIRRNADGTLCTDLPPQLELSVPILFSAMSYGSISYNAHAALARAAQELGICYNTGEGGLHRDFYPYGANTIVQVASGRFGVEEKYLNTGAAIEIKMGQGAKPGIGGHLPGAKIVGDVSKTRMIPEGADACYIATAALLAMGCHLCRSCQTGRCCWGIATQRPDLVKRLDPQQSAERLVNLATAWKHEIKEMMGGMGINSIEALRGNRVMLRGIHLTDKELEILGVAHAGE